MSQKSVKNQLNASQNWVNNEPKTESKTESKLSQNWVNTDSTLCQNWSKTESKLSQNLFDDKSVYKVVFEEIVHDQMFFKVDICMQMLF